MFEPRLWTTPLIVLSNNDGTVVAVNDPGKAIGLEKGRPFFQIRHLTQEANLAVRSSNFALYGDMSYRVMQTLRQFTPVLEVYSIDEAFLSLSHVPSQSRTDYAHHIRATVQQHTGIIVSIGVAETKTLAKVVNRFAKKVSELNGVLDITEQSALQKELLCALPVQDTWGIGHRWGQMLVEQGIDTALKLRELPDGLVRKYMGVVGLRTVFELRGQSCLLLQLQRRQRKSLMVSRSFGRSVWEVSELKEAVATFAARAAWKLRGEHLAAGAVTVFVSSSRFKDNYYSNSTTSRLMTASNHTPTLLKYASMLTEKLWRDDIEFAKAGVIFTRLTDENVIQLSLFDERTCEDERATRLIHALDELNLRYGRDAVRYAAMGTTQRWQTRAKYRSPRWTTRWDEIPIVKC
ncbi:MAG: Y-family DNA polymerase [Chroococcidiopsidaceae cyanobacterium CP_BM_RX_35]|nr:Y-family DNA polymerase [Chroococcidiopsidaceae cyanobacterium CP_BM_RX_35]